MELVVKINGQETSVKMDLSSGGLCDVSCYACKFDENSGKWSNDRQINQYFLKYVQTHMNDRLKAQGHLFLNEVYDVLDVPRTNYGQVCGWVYDPKNPIGDNYVDLDIFNARNDDPDENVFILDPNVDGFILDKI